MVRERTGHCMVPLPDAIHVGYLPSREAYGGISVLDAYRFCFGVDETMHFKVL